MPKSIEDILVCIHDERDHDEHTKLGRVAREVDAHLVPFGRYTATERVRIGRAFRDKNLGTQLSDCIADMIHNTSRRRRALTAVPGSRHAYADDRGIILPTDRHP